MCGGLVRLFMSSCMGGVVAGAMPEEVNSFIVGPVMSRNSLAPNWLRI